MPRFFLIGDVGPATVTLRVTGESEGLLETLLEGSFPSARHRSLEEIVGQFLHGLELPFAGACFSVAGPVVDEQVWFPNLDWYVDQRRLGEALRLPAVRLVNDLQATALALPYLEHGQLATLQMGVPEAGGVRAVLSAGAGLGEAVLVTEPDGGFRALPSEGGHADFAPVGPLQEEMLAHLRAATGHVSYEQVCSLPGIATVHAFVRGRGGGPQDGLPAADDAAAILEAGLGEPPASPACRETLETVAAILGAEAGNLALRTLATGGVYVGGELALRLLPLLRAGGFLAAFRDKGKMSDLIRRIPLHLVLEPHAALLGATRQALAAQAAPLPPLP